MAAEDKEQPDPRSRIADIHMPVPYVARIRLLVDMDSRKPDIRTFRTHAYTAMEAHTQVLISAQGSGPYKGCVVEAIEADIPSFMDYMRMPLTMLMDRLRAALNG